MKPLFIPLKRKHFEAFKNGTKKEELRPEGPRWNARTCQVGRPVVLSLGYGKANRLTGYVAGFRTSKDETRTAAWKDCYGNRDGLAACIHIELDRAATPVTSPVIRYHGAKFRMAPWVMQFFPPHRIYCEPFGGAAGVLMRKPRAYSEVYNDLDDELTNLFRVMQDSDRRQRLTELLVLTPYARREFELAWRPAKDPVERARRLVIRAQMGFGSAGATKGTTGFRIDTKREYETAQHVWAMYPGNLAAVGMRLAGVLIENRPAIEVIQGHDTPDTLFYVDPPYVHETRCRITGKGSARGYRHEMDEADHKKLLEALLAARGMVVLSGYPHPLYDDVLRGWTCHATEARISGNRGTAVRTEVVWLNPACSEALERDCAQRSLFMGEQAA